MLTWTQTNNTIFDFGQYHREIWYTEAHDHVFILHPLDKTDDYWQLFAYKREESDNTYVAHDILLVALDEAKLEAETWIQELVSGKKRGLFGHHA